MSFMSFVPAGVILPYGGTTAPDGWLLCNGAAISQASYPALYAAIGVNWGDPGGGSFNIPDGRGAFFRGVGSSGVGVGPATVGAVQSHATAQNGMNIAGSVAHNLGINGGGHSHTTAVYGFSGAGLSGVIASTSNGSAGYSTSSDSHTHGITGGVNNGTLAVTSTDTETRPNSRGVNYIIKI